MQSIPGRNSVWASRLSCCALVAHESAGSQVGQRRYGHGRVLVFELPIQVGVDVVHVHPLAARNRACGVTYGKSVFDYVLAGRYIAQCELVPGGYGLDCAALARDKRAQCHGNVVSRVDFKYWRIHAASNWRRGGRTYSMLRHTPLSILYIYCRAFDAALHTIK